MRKFKGALLALLSLACIGTAFSFAGCGADNGELNNSNPNSGATGEESQIEQIYAQYVIYAQAEGVAPLSYEEWLATIKGEKGDKGDKGDKGVGIESVAYDKDGSLVITLTDGTTQTVEVPNNVGEQVENLNFQKIDSKEEYRVAGIGNVSFTDIVIPSTYRDLPVTEIGKYAFEYGAGGYITSVVIPNSVTTIGVRAFSNCDELTSITFEGTVEEWNAISKGGAWNDDVPATEVVCSDGTVAL